MKLYMYGISGKTHRWIKHFLGNRPQEIVLNGSISERRIIIIMIMVIPKCYFSREHIALSYKKWCGHRTRKNQQIKGTAQDGKSYLK